MMLNYCKQYTKLILWGLSCIIYKIILKYEDIIAFQGYPFRTATGLPFRYKIKIGKDGEYNRELMIDRREKSKTLSWSSVKLAFDNSRVSTGIIEKPKALGDIRGISYIYPILWRFGLIHVLEKTEKAMMRKTG